MIKQIYGGFVLIAMAISIIFPALGQTNADHVNTFAYMETAPIPSNTTCAVPTTSEGCQYTPYLTYAFDPQSDLAAWS